MVKIKCHNCEHLWDYTGKKKFYATCPSCRFNVNIINNTVKEDESGHCEN